MRVFKSVSLSLLPPLGAIFGLLVAFSEVQAWNDMDRAKVAVDREASSYREVRSAWVSLIKRKEGAGKGGFSHTGQAVNKNTARFAPHGTLQYRSVGAYHFIPALAMFWRGSMKTSL